MTTHVIHIFVDEHSSFVHPPHLSYIEPREMNCNAEFDFYKKLREYTESQGRTTMLFIVNINICGCELYSQKFNIIYHKGELYAPIGDISVEELEADGVYYMVDNWRNCKRIRIATVTNCDGDYNIFYNAQKVLYE